MKLSLKIFPIIKETFNNYNNILTMEEVIMGIYKIIDIVGTSENSFSEAAKNAVTEAAKTVKNIKRAEVRKFDVKVVNDKVVLYRAEMNIAFEIER
jgi:flavin-binding protein dodecin